MDFYTPPVQRFWIRPTEVFVEQSLLARAVHQILAPDDVCDPLLMVLDGALKVEQRPHLVAITDHRVRGVLNPQGRPVAQSRVRQSHFRPHPDHCIALLHLSGVHRLPVGQALSGILTSAGAVLLVLAQIPERHRTTAAYIAESSGDHPLCMLKVDRHPITGADNDVGRVSCQPFVLVSDPVVGIRNRRLDLGVGVIEA